MSDKIITNQRELIHQFSIDTRPSFNLDLFERNDDDLIQALENVILSCQRDKYYTLKVLSFEAIYDYEEIYNTLRNYEEKQKKKNSKIENSYDFINIRDTDIILIGCVYSKADRID